MYNCSYSAAGGLSWQAARLHDKTKHLYACVELGLGISRAFWEGTLPGQRNNFKFYIHLCVALYKTQP